MKNVLQPKRSFYQRGIFWWPIGSVLGLILLVLLAFAVSPWPGALIIRADFTNDADRVLAALQKHTPDTPVATVTDITYRPDDKDAKLDVYYPQSIKDTGEQLPVIIWTHGGAWISGDKSNAAPYYKLLAAAGYTVIALNYSYGPEKTYPTAVYQLDDAYIYIQNNAEKLHADTDKIILAGDSAGSQLSSQMAGMITNPDYAKKVGITMSLKPEQLKGLVLNCGIYDMKSLTTPDPTLPKIVGWGTDVSVWAYTGSRDFESSAMKQMSSINHLTKDFPPSYISGGNADPLTSAQSQPLAEKLTALGVDVTTLFYPANHTPALPHEYQFNLDNADGENALAQTLEFIKAKTAQ